MSDVTTMSDETAARAAATSEAPEPGLAHDEAALLAPLYPLPRPELASAKGARVVDTAGREFLDFVSGIAVHAPRASTAALLRRLVGGSTVDDRKH